MEHVLGCVMNTAMNVVSKASWHNTTSVEDNQYHKNINFCSVRSRNGHHCNMWKLEMHHSCVVCQRHSFWRHYGFLNMRRMARRYLVESGCKNATICLFYFKMYSSNTTYTSQSQYLTKNVIAKIMSLTISAKNRRKKTYPWKVLLLIANRHIRLVGFTNI